MYLCYITRPRKEKSVYFASFRGQYSDNPRAISECLHRMAPEVKIVWLVKHQFRKYVPDYVTVVPPKLSLALKAQAQAKVWVMNYTYRKQSGIYKGRDNFCMGTEESRQSDISPNAVKKRITTEMTSHTVTFL